MKVSNASFGHMISWRLTSADLDGTSAMSQNVFASVGRLGRGPQVHHRPLEIVGCERKKSVIVLKTSRWTNGDTLKRDEHAL